MLELDPVNLEASIAVFMRSYTVLDLLNHKLESQSTMEELLSKNQVCYISSKLPGIIIQVYLLLAKKFGLDVFGPLTGEVRETVVDNVHPTYTCTQMYPTIHNVPQPEQQKIVIEEVKQKALPSLVPLNVPLNVEHDPNEMTLVLEEIKTEYDDTGRV